MDQLFGRNSPIADVIGGESDFVEASLDQLPADNILEIMRNMDPESILRLCDVNTRFREFCSDNQVWTDLMRKHYPDYDETNEPKEQFKDLARPKELKLSCYVLSFPDDYSEMYRDTQGNDIGLPSNIGTVATIGDVEPQDELSICIKGPPMKNGTKKWILIYDGYDDTDVIVFKDKETIVDYYMQNVYPNLLDDVRVYADQEIGEVNQTTVNDAAEQMKLPVPFTHANVKTYLEANNLIFMLDESEPNLPLGKLWLIREITFNQ